MSPAEEIVSSSAVFVAKTLGRARDHACVIHEEKHWSGSSTFTAILPGTGNITGRPLERAAALESVCKALVPYLDRYDREAADAAAVHKTKLTEPGGGHSLTS